MYTRTHQPWLVLLAGLFVLSASASPTDVLAQGKIVLAGNNPVLRIETKGFGIVDATADTKILWKREDVPTKITVQTMCPGQSFFLVVRAVNLSAGISAGEVPLRDGMAPVDLIVNIPTGNRMEQARLLYVAAATVAQGNSDEEGADSHIVTYTLVQQ